MKRPRLCGRHSFLGRAFWVVEDRESQLNTNTHAQHTCMCSLISAVDCGWEQLRPVLLTLPYSQWWTVTWNRELNKSSIPTYSCFRQGALPQQKEVKLRWAGRAPPHRCDPLPYVCIKFHRTRTFCWHASNCILVGHQGVAGMREFPPLIDVFPCLCLLSTKYKFKDNCQGCVQML